MTSQPPRGKRARMRWGRKEAKSPPEGRWPQQARPPRTQQGVGRPGGIRPLGDTKSQPTRFRAPPATFVGGYPVTRLGRLDTPRAPQSANPSAARRALVPPSLPTGPARNKRATLTWLRRGSPVDESRNARGERRGGGPGDERVGSGGRQALIRSKPTLAGLGLQLQVGKQRRCTRREGQTTVTSWPRTANWPAKPSCTPQGVRHDTALEAAGGAELRQRPVGLVLVGRCGGRQTRPGVAT